MRTRDSIIAWLLAGDPAIRWQTLRDLVEAPPEEVHAERARVAREGWGAAILSLQREDGSWPRATAPPTRPTTAG